MKIKEITEHPISKKSPGGRLGRHIEHDPRSRSFALTPRPQPLVTKFWNRTSPILNQGSLGSCTGNALVGFLGTEPASLQLKPGTVLDEKLAVEIYSRGTQLDLINGCYPPTDTGSSGLAVCKAAIEKGLISSYRHTFGFSQALAALSHDGPLIVGTNWYEGMDSPDDRYKLKVTGQVRGGHEYEVVAIEVDLKLVRMVQSWGDQWGDKGYAWITFDDFERLLAEDGDCILPIV